MNSRGHMKKVVHIIRSGKIPMVLVFLQFDVK